MIVPVGLEGLAMTRPARMHLPFPGLGHVRTEGKGYAWVPVEFSPIRSDK